MRIAQALAVTAVLLLACIGAALPARAAAPLEIERDIAYGPDPAQRLDIYRTDGLHDAPVVIIVHGGAYLFGDKAAIPFPTLALFLAQRGFVVASMNYRLAPAVTWPASIQDVASAVAFMHGAAPRFGGNPGHIVLLGHSAGATHVAGYVFDRRFQPEEGPGIRAAILVSGRYILSPDPLDDNEKNWETYFGTDPELWHDRAPIDHVHGAPHVPVLLVLADHENRGLDVGGAAMRRALCTQARHCPVFMKVEDATHSSEMARGATPGTPFSERLLRFIATARG